MTVGGQSWIVCGCRLGVPAVWLQNPSIELLCTMNPRPRLLVGEAAAGVGSAPRWPGVSLRSERTRPGEEETVPPFPGGASSPRARPPADFPPFSRGGRWPPNYHHSRICKASTRSAVVSREQPRGGRVPGPASPDKEPGTPSVHRPGRRLPAVRVGRRKAHASDTHVNGMCKALPPPPHPQGRELAGALVVHGGGPDTAAGPAGAALRGVRPFRVWPRPREGSRRGSAGAARVTSPPPSPRTPRLPPPRGSQ